VSRMKRLKIRGWKALLASAVILAMLIVFFSIWLNRSYPSVETTDDFTKLTTDEPQRAGDIVAWTKSRVCVPAGFTKSEIKATKDFIDPRNGENLGSLSTTLTERKFYLAKGYCASPNFTSIIIPQNLPNGTYRITITACTDNPTPRDVCIPPAPGPEFTVVGQPQVKLP